MSTSTISVGATVRLRGDCECSDERDCYHKSNSVRHVFQDNESVWVLNSHRFARRIPMGALVLVHPPSRARTTA
jgi:hypothetical protein